MKIDNDRDQDQVLIFIFIKKVKIKIVSELTRYVKSFNMPAAQRMYIIREFMNLIRRNN